MSKKYLIVGGVACGPKAAARLRRLDSEAEITIVEKGEIVSYGGCGMPYFISGDVKELKSLWTTTAGSIRDKDFFLNEKNIRVFDKTRAEMINRIEKKVEAIRLETGEKVEFSYDKLILAVGGNPAIPPIPGNHLKNIFKLSHPDDAAGIKSAADSKEIKSAVIIGGGLIGLEVTEALEKYGIKITIVEMQDRLLPKMLDKEMSVLLMKNLAKKGISISVSNKVLSFEGNADGNLTAVNTEQGTIPAELALIAVGVSPNKQLAEEAGLEITENGAIKVNEYLQTSDADIFAGGDCVDNLHLISGKRVYTPLGDLANIHGRIIANNICGKQEEFPGIFGTGVIRVLNNNVGFTGLTEEAAGNCGYDVVTVISPGSDRAHFYPGAGFIYTKLVGDQKTGRIIGAQIVGRGDVSKRINMLSAGMYNGLTADNLAVMDLAYAPPFAPALDNLITAANIMQNKLTGLAKTITAKEVKEKLDRKGNFILLDVRTPKEVARNSISYEKSENIPLANLRKDYGKINKNTEIVIYCAVGLRSYEAQLILEEKGFKKVKFLEGGILSWPY
ncbi:MAG: FAD-dependent oxidoreductase [Desulfitobacteriaceae bacterium]|nr:FAD-dependent oxidoreductase [Desulfitobacteriaceae bacterium]MDD4346196.1 FAD-dependent oxidoreductase [Desulfitobacteriaceae bacterium]MDD4401165.1 FAD-dependent oxidoreductase [Desulfitobacteriaceae bacterium]